MNIIVDGEDTTWEHFKVVNELTPGEASEILDSLNQTGRYEGGGGALAEFTITRKWTTNELMEHFSVLGFLAPFVTVRRKVDGAHGTMMFDHMPRFYFNFTKDR
jgi:hypothetical protein